jgi:hypothetical protein
LVAHAPERVARSRNCHPRHCRREKASAHPLASHRSAALGFDLDVVLHVDVNDAVVLVIQNRSAGDEILLPVLRMLTTDEHDVIAAAAERLEDVFGLQWRI